MSITRTTRRSVRRGTVFNVTSVITPKKPVVPPIASVKSSWFWLLHWSCSPFASINVNASTIRYHGAHQQSAAVNIRRESTAERQGVGTGLLLCDPPLRGHVRFEAFLEVEYPLDQCGPLNARFTNPREESNSGFGSARCNRECSAARDADHPSRVGPRKGRRVRQSPCRMDGIDDVWPPVWTDDADASGA